MFTTAPPLADVQITPTSFWGRRRTTNRLRTIPGQLKLLRETGQIAALKPDYPGIRHRFWDSDCGKWIEAAWSELAGGGEDPEIRAGAEEIQAGLAGAQEEDGYLQTHVRWDRTPNGTWWSGNGRRWENLLESHELYSMGHVIEGFCAQAENGLGRDGLAVAQRMVDVMWKEFGPAGRPWWDGHAEIEMALFRLSRLTGDSRAADLARGFVDHHGPEGMIPAELAELKRRPEDYGCWRNERSFDYWQASRPLREETALVGHAVRALYLCCGATDQMLAGDETLREPLARIWDSAIHRRMHVTGGLGAHPEGERMGKDYDLPDERAYCETCASIALARWARRLLDDRLEGEYGDILELTLHNAVLSGVSLDGMSYHYSNPTATHPHDTRDKEHFRRTRAPWFGVACCPPNVARTLAQLGTLACSTTADQACFHLYLPGTFHLGGMHWRVETGVPCHGRTVLEVTESSAIPVTLRLRIPSWTEAPTLLINGVPMAITPGTYASIARTWVAGDRVELDMPMPVQRLYAHPKVRQHAGQVALRRGPLIWCLEQEDHGEDLADLALPDDAPVDYVPGAGPDGVGILTAMGTRTIAPARQPGGPLYATQPPQREAAQLRFIPYAVWGNRSAGEMRVWVRRNP